MTFTVDLNRAIGNLKKNKDKIVRGTLLDLSRLIIKDTPVGNPELWAQSSLPAPAGYVGGSLRAGWNASFGSPDLSKSGKVDKNGAATISKVSNKIGSYVAGSTFYLANPLPYAYRVEYGWSKQAPQGMVRLNINKLQTILDSQ